MYRAGRNGTGEGCDGDTRAAAGESGWEFRRRGCPGCRAYRGRQGCQGLRGCPRADVAACAAARRRAARRFRRWRYAALVRRARGESAGGRPGREGRRRCRLLRARHRPARSADLDRDDHRGGQLARCTQGRGRFRRARPADRRGQPYVHHRGRRTRPGSGRSGVGRRSPCQDRADHRQGRAGSRQGRPGPVRAGSGAVAGQRGDAARPARASRGAGTAGAPRREQCSRCGAGVRTASG